MRRFFIFLHVFLLLLFTSLPAGAAHANGASASYTTTYAYGINEGGWSTDSSVFECTLIHSVPYYGEAIFRQKAGESSVFFLAAQTSRFQAGKATLLTRPPVWKHDAPQSEIGAIPVKRGNRPMWLGSNRAERMLAELNKGMAIDIVKDVWYEDRQNPPARLSISSIGFRAAYRKYLMCLGGLLPANYDQLKRTALYFAPNIPKEGDGLPKAIEAKLDNIVLLTEHDDSIKNFYIDGHASAPGEREYNLELSKRRAELVKQYLTQKGISEESITLRWHGERYPVASNATVNGRAKNRRVTIRLEKMDEINTGSNASTNTPNKNDVATAPTQNAGE